MELPTDTDRELIEAARAAIDANADTSGPDENGVHTMGAAVRDSEGRIHVGVNLAHFDRGTVRRARRAGDGKGPRSPADRSHRGGRQPRPRCRRTVRPGSADLFDYHPGIRVLLPTVDGARPP